MRAPLATAPLAVALLACSQPAPAPQTPAPQPAAEPAPPSLRHDKEVRFGEITQLTFGGENAEAYWSFDGKSLIFQSTRDPHKCDQIFRMPADAPGEPQLLSSGKGRTTCAYFFPGDRSVLYASTHLAGDECPPTPDRSQGYVWPLYASYDIFGARADGSDLRRLTETDGYDAEATVCPLDGSIIFTSVRDGDLELYRMDADGGNVKRLTQAPGYDGGAFFSNDCKKIVWRASRPRGAELDDYKRLLAQGLVRPSKLELWVANADGSEARQITFLDAASFGPYFFPDASRVIFSSNYGDPRGREFDLWAVDVDGTDLERVTHTPGFDGFPMFSPDGARFVFASNRNQKQEGDTDVYVTTWNHQARGEITPTPADQFLADVAWLADDARTGRGVGDGGLAETADWLAARLAKLGVEPAGDDGSFKQAFDVPVAVKATQAVLELDGVAIPADAFTALGFASDGDVAADVVLAGHGITAPDLKIDDYKGVKARGKIVVVRRFVPEDRRFADDKLERRYGDPRFKAWNAREHGAVGLIIVDVPDKNPPPPDAALPPLKVEPNGDAGIPVVVLQREQGAKLFDKKKHKARIALKLDEERRPVHNIVGVIRAGAADRREGAIVVGAHYDHLGMGGVASLAPGVSAPHNGADDNASGTAALLLVAERLLAKRAELARDVYIVGFSAEELGILGSTAFTRKPPAGLAMKDVVAMLNMDMVGRLRGSLTVSGADTATEWKDLVGEACMAAKIDCAARGDGYGPSDHTPFYAAGVPVLHFFTGAHREYHTPADDTALINAAGGARVATLVADVAFATAKVPQKLTYKSVASPPPQGDVRSRGGSLGTVPDYAGPPEGKTGVLLAGVRPGGPAEAAGLKRGDLLVKIDNHEIRNVEDFMFVLRKAAPGDKAKVTVERDGKKLTVDVVFGQSTRMR